MKNAWGHLMPIPPTSSCVRGSQPGQEETLQILCALLAGNTAYPGLESLTAEDWASLAALATNERVGPALYHSLKRSSDSLSVPLEILESLKKLFQSNVMRNLSLQYDLADRIVPALEGQVSPVVALKGATLAFTLYANPGLRQLGDLDILVPEDQVETTEGCLTGIGFHRDTTEVTEGFEEFTIHHLHLRRDGPHPLVLEVHRRLYGSETDWFCPSLDWFWTQLEPFSIPNSQGGVATLMTFNPTTNLLYLSSHLMLFHGEVRSQLLWFYDLHLILKQWQERIDWDLLIQKAQELEWAPAVSAALQGIQKRFGTPIPGGVIERLDSIRQERAAEQVRMRSQGIFLDRAVKRWMVLKSKDWPGRIKVLWTFLFPSPEYIRWRHHPNPQWIWPLYYPYRWGYMFFDAALAVWKLMRK